MGTSDAYAGSGGAWNGIGRDVEHFHASPSAEVANGIAEQLFAQLRVETEETPEGVGLIDLIDPTLPALPGLRISTSGRSGDGGTSGGAGGGRSPSRAGGGRSRSRIARSGGRALAAGSALRRGDDTLLRELGLNLADLTGLDVLDQVARILNVSAPATGLQSDAELRHALTEALLTILEGDDSPQAAIEAFIAAYTFEVLVTETGARERNGERAGALTRDDERQLRTAIEAYVRQLDLNTDLVSENDFRLAIETVFSQAGALVL